MNKCFIPPLNSQWKLLNPWPLDKAILTNYNNDTALSGMGISLAVRSWPDYHLIRGQAPYSRDWVPDFHAWVDDQIVNNPVEFPVGTVFQFNRYHFSNSGTQQATLEVIGSPEKRFSPKKAGGLAKGKLRIYLTLAQLNDFPEIEPL